LLIPENLRRHIIDMERRLIDISESRKTAKVCPRDADAFAAFFWLRLLFSRLGSQMIVEEPF